MFDVKIMRVVKHEFINYSYLLIHKNTQQAMIVDPAWDFEQIKKAVEIEAVSVCGILVTHHHFDHINLAETFSVLYNVPVYVSKKEYCGYNLHFSNVKLFDNDELISFENFHVKTIFTPGHTSGGCCFLVEGNLFSGDTLFIEGCGSCSKNEIGGSSSAMFDSLCKLKSVIDDEILVFPGHKFSASIPQTFENVKRMNIYLQINDKNQFIRFREENTKRNFDFS